jgi:hypothetical protein
MDTTIVIRLLFFMAAVGFLIEGLFELKRVHLYITRPPSVPGYDKILEHFGLQHIVFPWIGLGIAFFPAYSLQAIDSDASRWLLLGFVVLVAIPETIVSFGKSGDLFRPYPFDLRNRWLKKMEMVKLGGKSFNLLQAQHLLLNHWMYLVVFAWFAFDPLSLKNWLKG